LEVTVGQCRLYAETDIIGESLPKFVVFPNPAEDIVNIDFTSVPGSGAYISIHDMSGRKLLSQPVRANQLISLDISSYNRGVYVIKMIDGNQEYTSEVVKGSTNFR